jgi:hypothetical protein
MGPPAKPPPPGYGRMFPAALANSSVTGGGALRIGPVLLVTRADNRTTACHLAFARGKLVADQQNGSSLPYGLWVIQPSEVHGDGVTLECADRPTQQWPVWTRAALSSRPLSPFHLFYVGNLCRKSK